MRNTRWVPIAVLILASFGSGQVPAPPETKPDANAAGSLKELQTRSEKLREQLQADFKKLKELPEADRDAAGEKIYATYQAEVAKVSSSVLDIAKSGPKSETGLSALKVALGMNLEEKAQQSVVAMLAEHHATSPAIAPVVARLAFARGKDVDDLLDTILASNPSKEAKGLACYGLASRARKETVKEELLERCAKDFGDVKASGGTLAQVAERELHALRNIKVGKVPPDIAGKDMDGTDFRLSDYRGKVVVLDFWGYW